MCERYINQLLLARPQLGTWPRTQVCALTGNQTGDLLVHRLVLNPLSHISLGGKDFLNKAQKTNNKGKYDTLDHIKVSDL